MSLQSITTQMRDKLGAGGALGRSVKFDFGPDGLVRVDDRASPPVVDNQDLPADCTVRVSLADFTDIAAGKANAQMAFMTGKLKVDGDMSVALKLGALLG